MTSNSASQAMEVDVAAARNEALPWTVTKQHAVYELYDPVMVSVEVFDASLDPDDPWKQTFVLPQPLLCRRSEYFEKMFNGKFAEGESHCAELDDVSPYIFRCFVGWLYTHQLFYDANGTHDPLAKQGIQIGTATEAVNRNADDADRAELDPSGAPWKRDLRNPITWAWHNLFDLYVFADKYVTTDFRSLVFETIQKKLLQGKPHGSFLPAPATVKGAVERLPPSAPLFRWLVDLYSIRLDDKKGVSVVEIAVEFEILPSDFLAACFVAKSRHYKALQCKRCSESSPGDCEQDDHTYQESRTTDVQDPCYYHEHVEGSAEAELCAARWLEWMARACYGIPSYVVERSKKRVGELAQTI